MELVVGSDAVQWPDWVEVILYVTMEGWWYWMDVVTQWNKLHCECNNPLCQCPHANQCECRFYQWSLSAVS